MHSSGAMSASWELFKGVSEVDTVLVQQLVGKFHCLDETHSVLYTGSTMHYDAKVLEVLGLVAALQVLNIQYFPLRDNCSDGVFTIPALRCE